MTGTPGVWSDLGHRAGLLWGSCRGTAVTPYRTLVLLDGSAPGAPAPAGGDPASTRWPSGRCGRWAGCPRPRRSPSTPPRGWPRARTARPLPWRRARSTPPRRRGGPHSAQSGCGWASTSWTCGSPTRSGAALLRCSGAATGRWTRWRPGWSTPRRRVWRGCSVRSPPGSSASAGRSAPSSTSPWSGCWSPPTGTSTTCLPSSPRRCAPASATRRPRSPCSGRPRYGTDGRCSATSTRPTTG